MGSFYSGNLTMSTEYDKIVFIANTLVFKGRNYAGHKTACGS